MKRLLRSAAYDLSLFVIGIAAVIIFVFILPVVGSTISSSFIGFDSSSDLLPFVSSDNNENKTINSVPLRGDIVKSGVISERMYRARLTSEQQSVYDALERGIRDMDDVFNVPEACTEDDIIDVFESLINDCPDMFWVGDQFSHRTSSKSGKIYEIQPQYNCSKKQKAEIAAQMNDKTFDVCDEASSKSSDYDKARTIWDWLSENIVYDKESANSQNIIGALLDKRTACAGYSRAFMFLCNKIGIPCMYVSGIADMSDGSKTPHAWNAYEIDGTIVYGDLTWSDGDDSSPIDYSWFCLSRTDISASHHADSDSVLPDGDSDKYEVWTITDCLYDRYDENTVCKKLINSRAANDNNISIRFTTSDEMNTAYDAATGASPIVTRLSREFANSYSSSNQKLYTVYKDIQLNAVIWCWKK